MKALLRTGLLAAISAFSAGCYHYSFEHEGAAAPGRGAGAGASGHGVSRGEQARGEVTFKERRPTYLNGFIGTGRVDTTKYCDAPVRTELRVTAIDVALSVGTLLIYTPHTLYVTCPAARDRAAAR